MTLRAVVVLAFAAVIGSASAACSPATHTDGPEGSSAAGSPGAGGSGPSGTTGTGGAGGELVGAGGEGTFATTGSSSSGGTPIDGEVCDNGLDDNGNAFVDEGCTCTLGSTQPCYLGAPGGFEGACAPGEQTCVTDGGEFGEWGPCEGAVYPAPESCDGSQDEDCDGEIDEDCACSSGEKQVCGSNVGACEPGEQECTPEGTWGPCTGGQEPVEEICNNGIDDDCDGEVDEGCIIEVPIDIDGDCVTAKCPPQAPHPVGCNIIMSGGDDRGCVANAPGSSVVYFQEGDVCGAGHVGGKLLCSSQPGPPLDANNCPINKSKKYYPSSPSGCPDT